MNWDTAPQEIKALRQQVAALTQERNLARNHAQRLGEQIGEEARINDAQLAALTKELSECRNQYIGLEGMYGLLQQERDGLLALDSITKEALSREQEALAASQAYTQRLRSAALELPPIVRGRELNEALALPDNTSALDARLAEERERMIHACEENGSFGAASIIRSLK